MKEALLTKFETGNARVGVIGLGYVGLPLAVEMAQKGFEVYGIDVSKEKMDILNNGKSYVMDISDNQVEAIIGKNFFPGDDFSVISKLDAVSICVPTPLAKTKEPDVSYINAVVEKLVEFMTEGTLVVLESTTYPGTTDELIKAVIEEKTSFRAGEDFFLCFSPERVDPGNQQFNTKNTPKVLGGATKPCLELGVSLYSSFLENIVPVSSTSVAEMVKLLENTFRSVNIGLVNELTMMCDRMGINAWEVIDAAATKPFGYMPFYPGPGIGGHCIPLDPAYLSWKAKMFNFYNRFIELASDVNGNMPRYALNQAADILNDNEKSIKGSKIFILGMAYKKNIDDLRESPALEIYRLLEDKGAHVYYHDPFVSSFKNGEEVVYSVELNDQNLDDADLVVIATDHTTVDYDYVIDRSKLIYDTRNVTKNYKDSKGKVTLLGGQQNFDLPTNVEENSSVNPK
ncbi:MULTISPECIES: nucleotide sugar dehydrogenase [Bacillales]|uniref:nucleotide sugar dehydrogenase n=1 Tax=Bacillales TaxID=1385 RepID=UPI0018839E54|nr:MULTISPECIES: nucleotide sugar dehydrogenase [Bacillaceae]MBF0705627.1 nucleotide sugar dehydrogenase [Pseudalkalibacillus hwajinpoensis]MDO6657214.1 nucleotide sugar dehydrogenase [Anaerobacillus sp. 1_MG-2023]